MGSGSRRLRTLRTRGGLEEVFDGGFVTPTPMPATDACLGTAGPSTSNMLRTGVAGLAVRPFWPSAAEFELAAPRAGPLLPSSMFMTSRRSSSSADSRDILVECHKDSGRFLRMKTSEFEKMISGLSS